MKSGSIKLFLFLFVIGIPSVGNAVNTVAPNAEKLMIALKQKLAAIKNASLYSMKKNRTKKAVKKDLFSINLSSKTVNFNKIHSVQLPVNPVAFKCTDKNLVLSGRKQPLRRMLYWPSKYFETTAKLNSLDVGSCNKGLWGIMRTYCAYPRDASVRALLLKAQKSCLVIYQRMWIQTLYQAQKKTVPMWAFAPATIKAAIARKISYAKSFGLRQPKNWYSTMITFLNILKFQPKNFDATNGFDFVYANYFGVPKSVATYNRTHNMLGGKLSKLSKSALYVKAIDELLGKNHSVVGTTPKLGLSYLDVNYLLNKVYLPEINAHMKELRVAKCAIVLRRHMRASDAKAVARELASPRVCKGYEMKISGTDVMRNDFMRMKLIEILAQKTSNPKSVVANAAIRIAGQIGAEKIKVCWLYENPYPESIKPTAGKNAHCSSFGKSGYHNVRPGYFNYVYKTVPLKKLTKLKIAAAREILKYAGKAGKSLDKKLKKAYRKAKGYKCLAWNVTVAKAYHGGGRYGKLYRYSNGGPRKIKCSKMRRNSKLKKVFKSWNNNFDTVYGGKMKSHWRIIRNYWRKKLRKERPAVIYVKRKI